MSIPGVDWGLEQDPTDDEIRLLFAIIRDASSSTHAPFKAFFAAYDDHFARHHLDKSHDNVVYRLGMRVVHVARRQHHAGRATNLLPYLTRLLEEHGVTCIENDDDDAAAAALHDRTAPVDVNHQSMINHAPRSARRASFSDARLDETWLSGNSAPLRPSSPPPPVWKGLLSQPARRRGREFGTSQRARSTSSRSTRVPQRTARETFHRYSSSVGQSSVDEDLNNPTLLFQPSLTQLEQNADAFYAISQLRTARQCLHLWHEKILRHQQAYGIACAHDSHLLLRQSFEVIQDRAKLERERRSQLSDILAYAARKRDLALMAKAFSHWDESTLHRKRVTSLAQMHALKVKYFAQWRKIAVENAAKVKFILGRKYVAIWRERVLRNRLALEQADAHFEESLMKRCFSRWFWNFCDRQAEGWHELQLMRHTLIAWRARIETVRQETAQAQQFRERRLTAAALRKVVHLYSRRRRQVRDVDQVRQRSVAVTCLQALQNEAKLRPVARTTVEMVAVNLKNKAFRVWSLHLQLTRQAAEVDRRRILQTAWTNWNDALRCKALAQRIDGRVLAESLYKWILQYRLRTLQKEKNAYLARAALLRWRQQTEQADLTLEDAETLFAARQRTRLLRFGMTRLHSALRVREDGHRAAIEFANGRAVPRVVHAWRARLEHLQRLDKWAVDARFYCLGTQTLSVWRDKATKHHNQRLREAYRQLRAHVKIRQARACLSLWRERSNHLENLQITANDHLQSQIQKIATSSIRSMQTRTLQHRDLDAQAVALDRTKLLASALSAMQLSYANVSEMSAQAILFRQESDVVLVVNTWKKLQWRAFTTARQRETAEAFRIRTREQRIRAMMRYWAGKTISRRAKRHFEEQREITTESPSLRPASRRAAAASLQGRLANVTAAAEEYPSFLEIGPSPFEEDLSRTFLNATVTTLPAYLRTPSRSSRRSTRFHSQYQNLYQRPVLPTPAHATPLVFDPGAFLGTSTPAYPPPTMPIVMPVRLKEMTTEPNANVNINESTTKASAPKTSTKTAASTSATTSPRAPLEKDASQGTPVRPTAKRAPSSTASTPQITPFSRKLRAGGVAMPLSSARPRLSAVGRSPIAERVSASPSAPGKGKASRINGTSNNSADHGSANEDRDEGDRDDDNNGDTPGRHSAGNDSNNENNNGNQVLGRSVLGTGKSVRFAAPTSASLSRARKSRFG